MSKNASIPAKALPDGVTEAAVMESIAENPYIGGFLDWNEKYGGGTPPTLNSFMEYCKGKENGAVSDPEVHILDPETQILQDYLNCNPQAGSYEILNVEPGEKKVGNKVLIGGQQADGTKSYYVCFQGTQDDEWLDNAEGMVQESTLQQRDAAQYFDRMVGEENITSQDQVIVTGHSKGGNKAQYVTLASANADLIDSCVALDGQGFSPEAVAMWEKYPDVYQERREKIILVAGENDYVHVLGERVATDENTYYIAYKGADCAEQAGISDFKSWHYNQFLFQCQKDADGRYVFMAQMQEPSVQGWLSQQVQDINDYLMSLPPEERLAASATVMGIMTPKSGGPLDGYTPGLTDVISTFNTLYELIDSRLGVWDDIMLAKYANPAYLTLETIHGLIRGLENLRNAWEQARVVRAQSQAQSLAQSNSYIYIDTVVWDQLGTTLRRLGGVNYAAIRRQLIDIREELTSIFYSLGNVLNAANQLRESASATITYAEAAIASFEMGNVIGGIYSTIQAAKSGLAAAKDAFNLAVTVISEATNLYNSVKKAVIKVVGAIDLIGVEDTVRALGSYLSNTAQEFALAEGQNVALMQKWGG